MVESSSNRFGGPWTEAKLRILEGYLKAYTTALKNQNFSLTYVDAFAGSGYVATDSSAGGQGIPRSEDGWDSEARSLMGSTKRAIEVDDKPFDSLIFVEKDIDRAQVLDQLRTEYRNRDIRIENSEANAFLQNWCEQQNWRLRTPWRGQRAVVFLDPFGTEVEWQTIEAVASTKSIDLWILFPISAISRMMPLEGGPSEMHAVRLDRIYGGAEWRTLYQPANQLALFDEPRAVRENQQAIEEMYLDKLRMTFPWVSSSPKWLRNSRNSPLFTFMFAAANPGQGGKIALRIANNLLGRERW